MNPRSWGYMYELLTDAGVVGAGVEDGYNVTAIWDLLSPLNVIRAGTRQWELCSGVEWPHARRVIRVMLQAHGFVLYLEDP